MTRQPGACPRNSQGGDLAKALPSSRLGRGIPGLLPDTVFPSSTIWVLARQRKWMSKVDTQTDYRYACEDRHACTHTLHSQTSAQEHAHTHRCVHARRPGGGTERLHKHQDAQRNRKKQKGKEEIARRSPCIPAPELWATHPDLSPLLTSPSIAPWGN